MAMPTVAQASSEARHREGRGGEGKGAEAAGEGGREGGSGRPIPGSYFPGSREEGEEAEETRPWTEADENPGTPALPSHRVALQGSGDF